jgi:branched-subunit amino acid aminotransferase/4-amino-4-deoxychorismate lyase
LCEGIKKRFSFENPIFLSPMIYWNSSKKDIFQKYSNLPYTAFHTQSKKIPLWEKHRERLQRASLSMQIPMANLETFMRQLMTSIDVDVNVILILVGNDIVACVDTFVPLVLDPCDVCLFGNPRTNPTIKNTSWMEERQYIEHKRPPGTTEMLLHRDGYIYEGLVTNFFAVMDGYVMTAPFCDVLPGTVAEAVISLCAKQGIKIIFDFPKLSLDWKGAFLTNANRWIHPIKSIRDQDGMLWEFHDFEFILELQSLLRDSLLESAIGL